MSPDEALATALQYPVLRLAGYLDTTPEEFTTKLSAALTAEGFSIVPSDELAGLRAALEAAWEIIEANVAEDTCRHGRWVDGCDGEDDDPCIDRSRRDLIRSTLEGVSR